MNLVTEGWEVICIASQNQDWSGALPFVRIKRWGLTVLQAPPLTPFIGPVMQLPNDPTKLSRAKMELRIHQALIPELPKHDLLILPLLPKYQNWLPYYWAGFGQRTLYTFQLDCTLSKDALLANMNGKTRTSIRKGADQYTISDHVDLERLHQLVQQSLARRGVGMRYPLDLLQRIYQGLHPSQQVFQLSACNSSNTIVASILLVCDTQWMYYLLSGRDHQLDQGGAIQFLLWEGIQLAHSKGLNFDFEGSIYPGIFEMVQGFGGKMVPYHQVFKGGNKVLDWVWKGYLQ